MMRELLIYLAVVLVAPFTALVILGKVFRLIAQIQP